jgi:hypothetical protein
LTTSSGAGVASRAAERAPREAISRAARNELVILMADKPEAVFEQLTGRTS